MLAANDPRWSTLTGGYRTPLDPRTLLKKLEAENYTTEVWYEVWGELHHQGDVGDASYAAVPLFVEMHQKRDVLDWNTYAVTAVIELARTEPHNPKLPTWLETDYFTAIQELARMGARDVLRTEDHNAVQAILGVLAIAKGMRMHAKFLVEYEDDELLELWRDLSGPFRR